MYISCNKDLVFGIAESPSDALADDVVAEPFYAMLT